MQALHATPPEQLKELGTRTNRRPSYLQKNSEYRPIEIGSGPLGFENRPMPGFNTEGSKVIEPSPQQFATINQQPTFSTPTQITLTSQPQPVIAHGPTVSQQNQFIGRPSVQTHSEARDAGTFTGKVPPFLKLDTFQEPSGQRDSNSRPYLRSTPGRTTLHTDRSNSPELPTERFVMPNVRTNPGNGSPAQSGVILQTQARKQSVDDYAHTTSQIKKSDSKSSPSGPQPQQTRPAEKTPKARDMSPSMAGLNLQAPPFVSLSNVPEPRRINSVSNSGIVEQEHLDRDQSQTQPARPPIQPMKISSPTSYKDGSSWIRTQNRPIGARQEIKSQVTVEGNPFKFNNQKSTANPYFEKSSPELNYIRGRDLDLKTGVYQTPAKDLYDGDDGLEGTSLPRRYPNTQEAYRSIRSDDLPQESQKYREAKCEKIEFSCKPTKIEVSSNGRRVYYGSDGLGYNEKRNYWFVDIGMAKDSCQLNTIKALPNGGLLINDFKTWDLILLDQYFEEKGRMKGHPVKESQGPPFYYKSINCRSTYDDNFILWLSGPSEVSVVKLKDMTTVRVKNFWLYNEQVAEPVGLSVTRSGKSIVGIGEIDEVVQTIHLYTGKNFVAVYELNDLYPKGTRI